MNKLNNYIMKMLNENGIEKEVSIEKNRQLLIKYFNEYKFESEDELNRFLTAFTHGGSIDKFNYIYNFFAIVDSNLVMRIYDEGYYLPALRPYHFLLGSDYFKKVDILEGFNF